MDLGWQHVLGTIGFLEQDQLILGWGRTTEEAPGGGSARREIMPRGSAMRDSPRSGRARTECERREQTGRVTCHNTISADTTEQTYTTTQNIYYNLLYQCILLCKHVMLSNISNSTNTCTPQYGREILK